jgi:hypothetical protein
MNRFAFSLLLALATTSAWAGELSSEAEECLGCHGDPKVDPGELKGGEKLALYVDKELFIRSVHGQQGVSCTDCHEGKKPDHATGEPLPLTRRELSRDHARVCANCHDEVAAVFAKSVHGRQLEASGDGPACVDCHGVHNIARPKESELVLRTPDVCGKCHTNEKLMAKYGVSTRVVRTYLADFHGMATTLSRGAKKGGRLAAGCTDCHGHHDIQRTKDPQSHVIEQNLQKTCQQCHTGATANFPAAWLSHWEPTPQKAPLVWAVTLFYKIFIPFMVCGLGLQIALHLWRTLVNR